MKNPLLLGSNSSSRQRLLGEAEIPFQVIGHNADETKCDLTDASLQQLVSHISREKMEYVCMPTSSQEGDVRFVLTADTLCMTESGVIIGKPTDREDAIKKLKQGRGKSRCGTAFCLDKRIVKRGQWNIEKRIECYVEAQYRFDVPDEWIERYLESSVGLKTAGAIVIEDFGAQFLCDVHGSYSTIIGLPMLELREALQEVGFFNV